MRLQCVPAAASGLSGRPLRDFSLLPMVNTLSCPACGKDIPLKRIREERVSRTLEYPVIDDDLTGRHDGRVYHNECVPFCGRCEDGGTWPHRCPYKNA